MRDTAYLALLARDFPNRQSAISEIINLNAILGLPKGTEYFFSDIHGEDKAFIHLLRSSSGVIRTKISDIFGQYLTEKEQSELAELIYYPKRLLRKKSKELPDTDEWQKLTIYRLIQICRHVSSKYTRSKVRKKIPKEYAYIVDELLQVDDTAADKQIYYQSIVDTIIRVGSGGGFIQVLCDLIHNLTIDSLHIIGDIFDRGPHPDLVMEQLCQYQNVDIQWGNHDIDWMGAFCGNTACVCNVVRIAMGYNNFDLLEDGYGINLRPLSMFAQAVYGNDPCSRFMPHILDENEYDAVAPELAARMHKAITVIQMKLEGQLILRHPEYQMQDRLLLDKVDYQRGVLVLGGKEYPLTDKHFPTIDPKAPYTLTKEEQDLLESLRHSFRHSRLLQKHIRFLYTHGSMYKCANQNLLFHGCIPMTADGEFDSIRVDGKKLSGKKLMDYFNQAAIDAYYMDAETPEEEKHKQDAVDMMWYLWCGRLSPLFGKSRMASFELRFTEDKEIQKEAMNPYYKLIDSAETVNKILREFGVSEEKGHIVNGHVPVKLKEGELPYRAGGKLFIIDGGLAKAYHKRTGIAGYTLIYNSENISIAAHEPFVEGKELSPRVEVVERMSPRVRVADTDTGVMLKEQIADLEELLEAFRDGAIKEQ
ncbi:MAG: fructose-1,6-bisphosphatase [Eubacteriales bacterium]|nr:fructose-1,6-bisphosphatase [Eubacteriales bacterium]